VEAEAEAEAEEVEAVEVEAEAEAEAEAVEAGARVAREVVLASPPPSVPPEPVSLSK
jgi:hypothetical protein